MGVNPKIGGKPPKWMVKIMENPIKMDDLGVPLFLETIVFTCMPRNQVTILDGLTVDYLLQNILEEFGGCRLTLVHSLVKKICSSF